MRKQIGIFLLLLCAAVANAQFLGPGYMYGHQKTESRAKYDGSLFRQLREAVNHQDCAAVKKVFSKGLNPNVVAWGYDGPEKFSRWCREWFRIETDEWYISVPFPMPRFENYKRAHIVAIEYARPLTLKAAAVGDVCILKEFVAQGYTFPNYEYKRSVQSDVFLPTPYPTWPPELERDIEGIVRVEDKTNNELKVAVQNNHSQAVRFLLTQKGSWSQADIQEAKNFLRKGAIQFQQNQVKTELKQELKRKNNR